MFDFLRGVLLRRERGEYSAYVHGANGQNCTTDTRVELAAWFQGIAAYARRARQ